MQLKDISTTNFYILKDINDVKAQYEAIPLLRSIPEVLSRVVITVDLLNVRLLEVISLQKFGTVKVTTTVKKNDQIYKVPKKETIDSVEEFTNSLHLKEGSDNFFYSLQDCFFECPINNEILSILDYEAMPIGFPEFDCTLTMSGPQILNVFGYDLEKFFITKNPMVSLEDNIADNIYQAIFNGVYKDIIQDNTMGHDIISGAWLSQNVYGKFKKNFTIASIIGDRGSVITFIDVTSDELNKQIVAAKNQSDETYKAEITCCTSLSFYYYLKLFTQITISDCEEMSAIMLDSAELSNLDHISPKATAAVKSYNAGYIKYDCIKHADILTNLFMLPASRKISYTIMIRRVDFVVTKLQLQNLNHPDAISLVSLLDALKSLFSKISN